MLSIIYIIVITIPLLLAVAYLTLGERKLMGAMQMRIGPNVIGMLGVLQPLADGLKLFFKEGIMPTTANKLLFIFSPIVALIFGIPVAIAVDQIHVLEFTTNEIAWLFNTCNEVGINCYTLSFGKGWWVNMSHWDLFVQIQQWVVNNFPSLHEAVLKSIQTGCEFQAEIFVDTAPSLPKGWRGTLPRRTWVEFCHCYNYMLRSYFRLTEMHSNLEQPTKSLLTEFLRSVERANYLIKHSPSLSDMQLKEALNKFASMSKK